MSKPNAFDYKANISNTEIIDHLEKILAGLKAGRINLSQDSNALSLDVKPEAKFSIQVKETTNAKSLKLKIKWRDVASPQSDETAPGKLTIN